LYRQVKCAQSDTKGKGKGVPCPNVSLGGVLTSSARGMLRPRRSFTLPKLAQITGPSSHHLAAPDLFRLWSVPGDALNCAQDRAVWRTYATASSASRWRWRRRTDQSCW